MKVKTQFLLNLRLHLVAVVGPYQSSAFSWYSWIFNCFQIFFPVFIFSWLFSSLAVALAHSIWVQRRGGRWWVERRVFRRLRRSHKTQRILRHGSAAATCWVRPGESFLLDPIIMTNCFTFVMQSNLSWQSCSTWQVYNVCCLVAIYAVLTQHPFRRILRTFVWSKN